MENDHDDLGYAWAYIQDGLIVWDDKMTLADPDSFCVLEHEITECFVGRDEVTVTKCFVENAERLAYLEQQRETKYWKMCQDKKAVGNHSLPDVHSKDAKAAFAKKCKALEDAATASDAAAAAATATASDAAAAAAAATDSAAASPTKKHKKATKAADSGSMDTSV
ncbi:hypothetical protein B0H10DRAFT_1949668 [Mycena sp. CBHHK59/15]|nr:hypothetical protein B0H10DRAFT_1949668 [Mycena sp. CBHHK59/15]